MRNSGNFQSHHTGDKRPEESLFTLKFNPDWMNNQLDESAIQFTEEFGKKLVENKLTTSQIRNFFGEVRRLQMKLKHDPNNEVARTGILLLRPKLAYAAKRKSESGTAGSEMLQKHLDQALKIVGSDSDKFNRFADFFESILAFHKVNGGK